MYHRNPTLLTSSTGCTIGIELGKAPLVPDLNNLSLSPSLFSFSSYSISLSLPLYQLTAAVVALDDFDL